MKAQIWLVGAILMMFIGGVDISDTSRVKTREYKPLQRQIQKQTSTLDSFLMIKRMKTDSIILK
jgi:hypothetical protein